MHYIVIFIGTVLSVKSKSIMPWPAIDGMFSGNENSMANFPRLKKCISCKRELLTRCFALVDYRNPGSDARKAICEFCEYPNGLQPVKGSDYWYMTREGLEAKAANVTYHSNKRRCQKLKATPSWADQDKIRAIYLKAEVLTKTMGRKYEVDHIIPLVSPVVCGLHVETNLQAIPAAINRRKSNKFSN